MRGKHRAFCRHYALNGNGAEAVRFAEYNTKYPEKKAYRLLKRDDIQAQIIVERGILRDKIRMTDDDLIGNLEGIARDAHRDSDRTRATELLMKVKGMLKDTPTQQTVVFNDRAAEMVSKRLAERVKSPVKSDDSLVVDN